MTPTDNLEHLSEKEFKLLEELKIKGPPIPLFLEDSNIQWQLFEFIFDILRILQKEIEGFKKDQIL